MKNKVLLIDDDVIICELGKEMFELLDIEAHTSETLEEALTYFKANHQDVAIVLIDFILGEVSGVDVYNELVKISTDFTAVLASGIFVEDDAPKYSEMGFKEIVRKPYNLATLKELIAKYITN